MGAVRVDRVAGIAMLLLPILTIAGYSVGADVGEHDLFARDEIDDLLLAIDDHMGLYALSVGAQVLIDAIWVPLIAGLLYVLFRDRSQPLALVGTLGLLLASSLYLVHDSAVMTVGLLAADYVDEGGAGGIAAGADVTLQSARAMAIFEGFTALSALTVTGFGLVSYGALIGWAPAGERNPPQWLGFVALAGGIGYLLTWSFLLDHTVGGAIVVVAELATMISFAWLGVWFLRQPGEVGASRREEAISV